MSESDPKGMGTNGAVVRESYDWSRVRPTTAVVETVAAFADRDALGMEPLNESVPTDPLDALFRDADGTPREAPGTTVTLTYLGYDVTVGGDGLVTARPAERTNN